MGYYATVGNSTLFNVATNDNKFSIDDNTTKTITSGTATIKQGTNLVVTAGITMTGNESYLPGNMNATGTFSTTINHKLIVNYYSNNATSAYDDYNTNGVAEGKNVLLYSANFYHSNNYENGLHNYTSFGLTRAGYTTTGKWGTSITGGNLVDQNASHTGASLAAALGKNISSSDQSVNIYAQWILDRKVKLNGEWKKCIIKVKQNGKWKECYFKKIDNKKP